MIENEQRPLSHLSDAQVRAQLEAHGATAGQRYTAQSNPVAQAAEVAMRAMGFHEHFTPGIDEPKRIPTPAVGSGGMSLDRALSLAGAADGVYGLNMVPAGETNDLDPRSVIEANSRVVTAGARLIIAHKKPRPIYDPQSGNNHPGFYEETALVRHVDPAAFATVVDGADAALSPFPIHDASFAWGSTPHQAFHVKSTRAQHRAVGGAELNDAFMVAILRGLGELADQLLLNAILAATPAAFTFGAAAARHAKYDELRALVGTAGTGAGIAGDGSFRAGGVFAELTAATDKTVVGLFNRAAIAFRPELSVHVKRLNVVGDTELTVFANAQAVVPNPAGDFWTVNA
ncbi:hypothetical protein GRT41_15845 [Burkholderia pseudomallei]|uniref:hypothetical protein n=1 Tax=Burkholderia pseudomallei TaxID=28450 RepID=UPI000DC39DFA|nr:hypothetical protein [Burkholderia pseudomallei]MXK57953.1 hypothetical protein [Burkholderia pseudomallei]MXN57414.1 hypothetical protein [Burkholderia pseudomallei]RAP82786.1 hypothetical protein DPQ97_24575 [Burkholderia pseudomallei]RAP83677.1 hypothetical protein DPR01_27130 [Burkholderia pseudomallei]RAQ04777.1 hypothetical protein DPQ98_24075 [Burkholderia pseudomallei]